jgi:hypothetical protein
MQKPINTIPVQQFIQKVKAADRSQQRELRIDIKEAKELAFCLTEISSKLLEDYDRVINSLSQSTGQSVTIQMDGGGFK